MSKYTISRGATINLGRGTFETARVDISMEFETETTPFEEGDAWVKSRLKEAVADIQTAASLPPHPTDRFTG